MGADIISTDDVVELRAFFAARAARQRRPLLHWRLRLPSTPLSVDVAVRQLFGRRAAVWADTGSP